MTINEIRKKIDEQRGYLKETYGVESIGVFGSAARGEMKDGSDIDMLVKFEKPISYFVFYDFEQDISKFLGGRKVDIVTQEAIKPILRPYIEKDLITI